jgi:glycosyltransferase involved in cell wall biosynthesis
MKIAYVAPYDPRSINTWAGGCSYFMAQEFQQQGDEIAFIGPLEERFKRLFGLKWRYYKYFEKKDYLLHRVPFITQQMAMEAAKKIATTQSDLVLGPLTLPFAYLDCKQPVVCWTDATFTGLVDFYFKNTCQESIRNGHLIDQLALDRCSLAIYTSDWAAKSAIEDYGADPKKVKVVPYGANLDQSHSLEDIKTCIDARPNNTCKLLFLGVDWVRKGGDVAYKVAEALNEAGLKTELTVAGCPMLNKPANFVNVVGFIDKSTQEGAYKLKKLIAESHFLILPSIADCTPLVFCEANSLGVPCLSTQVGGIPTTIRSGVNGQLFDLNVDISDYCRYLVDLFSDYTQYQSLALSAFHEYESRLNWAAAVKQVRQFMKELL